MIFNNFQECPSHLEEIRRKDAVKRKCFIIQKQAQWRRMQLRRQRKEGIKNCMAWLQSSIMIRHPRDSRADAEKLASLLRDLKLAADEN